jgi:hypothetical protein
MCHDIIGQHFFLYTKLDFSFSYTSNHQYCVPTLNLHDSMMTGKALHSFFEFGKALSPPSLYNKPKARHSEHQSFLI